MSGARQEPRERKPSSSSSDGDNDGNVGEGAASTSDRAGTQLDYIQRILNRLGLSHDDEGDSHSSEDHVLKTVDFDGLVDHWKNNGFKKIVTMVGAGISTCKKISL